MRWTARKARRINKFVDLLTDKTGWVAAVAVIVGLVGGVLGILRPWISRRMARTRLALSAIEVLPPPEYSPRAELRFQMSNAGEGAVFVRSVRLIVETRRKSNKSLIVRPGADVPVLDRELRLRAETDNYDVLDSRYTAKNAPKRLEEAESEAFVVGVISERGLCYSAHLTVEWYDIKRPENLRTTQSDTFILDFPAVAAFA
jgi:hypothetical protein